MKGFLIIYESKDSNSKTLLNASLYGRLVHRNYRGKKYVVYKKGLLHDVLFYRPKGGQFFVEKIDNLDIESLKIFGKIFCNEVEIEDEKVSLVTGENYWINVCTAKNFNLKRGKK